MSKEWESAADPAPGPLSASTVMTKITEDRVTTWGLLAALSGKPDEELVRRLCDEPLLETLRASVRWLGQEWQPKGLLVLEVLPRQARRRGPEATLETMGDAHVAAGALIRKLHAACAEVHRLCLQEFTAWQAQETSEAKELRVQQMTLLTPDSPVRAHAGKLQQLHLPVYSHVAELVTAYLALETGR